MPPLIREAVNKSDFTLSEVGSLKTSNSLRNMQTITQRRNMLISNLDNDQPLTNRHSNTNSRIDVNDMSGGNSRTNSRSGLRVHEQRRPSTLLLVKNNGGANT